MKNIFDIKRFGKLLKSDLFTKLPRIYPNIIALLAVVPILMILHYTGIFDAVKQAHPYKCAALCGNVYGAIYNLQDCK
mgnify:CR=1 FL=1